VSRTKYKVQERAMQPASTYPSASSTAQTTPEPWRPSAGRSRARMTYLLPRSSACTACPGLSILPGVAGRPEADHRGGRMGTRGLGHSGRAGALLVTLRGARARPRSRNDPIRRRGLGSKLPSLPGSPASQQPLWAAGKTRSSATGRSQDREYETMNTAEPITRHEEGAYCDESC
jgi:hypothetical protein